VSAAARLPHPPRGAGRTQVARAGAYLALERAQSYKDEKGPLRAVGFFCPVHPFAGMLKLDPFYLERPFENAPAQTVRHAALDKYFGTHLPICLDRQGHDLGTCCERLFTPGRRRPSKVRYIVHVDSMVAILALVTRKLLEAAMVLSLAFS